MVCNEIHLEKKLLLLHSRTLTLLYESLTKSSCVLLS